MAESSQSDLPESAEAVETEHDRVTDLEAMENDAAASPADDGESSDSGPSAADNESERPFRAHHTSLQCLALVARHHSLDVSADRLIHDYSLENEEPSLRRIMRIAKDVGFKTRFVRLTWKHLLNVGEAFPLIVRLENGFSISANVKP